MNGLRVNIFLIRTYLNFEHFPGNAGVLDVFFIFSRLFLRTGLVDVLPMDMAIICSSMEPLGGAKIAL